MPDGRPGLAGLDDDMMDRIERGLLTKVEAARLLGVSKQALGKGLERRRARAVTAPAPEPARADPATADRSQPPSVIAAPSPALDDEAEKWAQAGGQAWRGLAHAYVAVVVEARDQVVAGRGKIGATTMNGLVRALRESEEGLRRLGLLPAIAGGNQASDQPPELVIRVLSMDEEAEIRTEIAERAGESLGDTAAESPVVPVQPVMAPSTLIADSLPSANDFRPWLEAQTYLKGAAWLRQIVAALGGKISHTKDDLIAELLHITGGNPERLRRLCHPG